MEGRIQRILLGLVCAILFAGPAYAEKPELLELEPLIVREEERRDVDVDQIDRKLGSRVQRWGHARRGLWFRYVVKFPRGLSRD